MAVPVQSQQVARLEHLQIEEVYLILTPLIENMKTLRPKKKAETN
jgi:hypothetical protein